MLTAILKQIKEDKPCGGRRVVTAEIEVTAFRQTRVLECWGFIDTDGTGVLHSPFCFGARVGRTGSKIWPSRMAIFQKLDGSLNPSLQAQHLNKQGVITGWLDESDAKNDSQHNSAAGRALLEGGTI